MLTYKTQKKNTLYYGKYLYRITFVEPGLHLWRKFHKNIYDYRDTVQEHLNYRLNSNNWSETHKQSLLSEVKNINYQSINKFIKWSISHKEDTKIRADYNRGAIFTSNEEHVREVERIFLSTPITVTKIEIINDPPGILTFNREPKHRYRVYFKRKFITEAQRLDFVDFFTKYSTIHPSKSLLETMYSPAGWRRSLLGNTYVEYDHESEFMIIALNFDNLMDACYECKKRDLTDIPG